MKTAKIESLLKIFICKNVFQTKLINHKKKAWTDWLKASRKLSEYADAEIYQHSMNLVLKHKWRILNNQYEDMTIYSGDQEKCFLGEDCTVPQLKESCYAERWDQLY